MRCFEFAHYFVDGLPIAVTPDGRDCVILAGNCGTQFDHSARAFLTADLSQRMRDVSVDGTFGNPRLMRCELEKTNELWLTPEQSASSEVLILLPLYTHNRDDKRCFAEAHDGCEIVAQAEFTRTFVRFPEGTRKYAACASLLKMQPGGSVKLYRKPSAIFFRKPRLMGEIRVDADGTPQIIYHNSMLERLYKSLLQQKAAELG